MLKTKDGKVRVGDLWLDDHNEVTIVTEIRSDMDNILLEDILVEAIEGPNIGRVYYENPSSFGTGEGGNKMFFHTLLSRSLNDDM